MNFRAASRDEPEINLIPFIDILLVVLIFLMLTTTYSKFTEIQLKLPVADTENLRSLSQARSRLANVDFPAPEGEDRIMRRPRRCAFECAIMRVLSLFYVLNLLAHLVDHGFEFQSHLGQGRVLCL